MRSAPLIVLAVVGFLTLPLVAQQGAPSPEARLQAAINKETVEGDLKAAIDLYKQLESSPNHAVAAKALLRMGDCYARLGNVESRKAYERVVSKYGDQAEAVAQARARLAALDGAGVFGKQQRATTRRVWVERSEGVSWAWWWGSTPSPDGRYMTFVDRKTQDLGIRDLASGALRQLTQLPQPARATQGRPVFSPDGRRIVYSYRDRSVAELRVVPVEGGQPRTLLGQSAASGTLPLDWSLDGKVILVSSLSADQTTTFALVSAQDGSIRSLRSVTGAAGGASGSAKLSPDGRFVVFGKFVSRSGQPTTFPITDFEQYEALTQALFVFPVAGGPERLLVQSPDGDREPVWMADGSILFLSDRSGLSGLWRIPVVDGIAQGQPEVLKADIGDANKLGLSLGGTYFYTVYSDRPSLYTATLDPETGALAGKPTEAVTRSLLAQFQTEGDWSPDGKSIVYTTRYGKIDQSGLSTLTVRSTSDGRERTLSLAPRIFPRTPRWATDGSIVVWATGMLKGSYGLYRVDSETGATRFLFQHPEDGVEAATARGLYRIEPEGAVTRLVFRDTASGAVIELLSKTEPARVLGASLSPDESHLAVVVGDTAAGTKSLQVMVAGGGPAQTLWTVSAPEDLGGQSATWSSDGRAVICIRIQPADGTVRRTVWRVPVDGSRPSYSGLTMDGLQATRAQPNGNRLLFKAGQWTTEFYALENFLPKPRAAGSK